jgi:hypothetical protein
VWHVGGRIWKATPARICVRLRRSGRRLGRWTRPIVEFMRLTTVMWPVSIVWLALSLCFLLPGLAESQAIEAMLEYAGAGSQPGSVGCACW